MGAKRYRFSGRFDPFGTISGRLTPPGLQPLTLLLQLDTTDNSRIAGTIDGGAWVANLLADRAGFNTRTNPARFRRNPRC